MSDQPDLTARARLIRDVLLQFSWDDFGLDEVDEAEQEWADHLAADIDTSLRDAGT